MENKKHKLLKKQAKDILLSEGFKKNEIYYEYKQPLKKSYVIIDVAGVNSKKKVLIECGNLSKDKKELLKGYCDKYIHLPYLNLLKIPEGEITTIRVRESVKRELEPYRKVYGSYEQGILELIKNFENP